MNPQFDGRKGSPGHKSPAALRRERAVALEDIPRFPPRWREVLLAILDRHNRKHGTKEKDVSFKTMEERRLFLFAFFRELRKHGYWIDPRSFGTRHIKVMMEAWTARDLSAAAVQRYLSHLRLFCDWIGKPGMVPPIEKLTSTPERFRRTQVAKVSKAWVDHDADPSEIVARADAVDPYVGAQLRMQREFGLRVKESIMLQPHMAIREVDGRPVLVVRRGAKGGREREVPIDSDAKRAALEHARSIARSPEHSLADPELALHQAYNRFFYVMKLIGATRGQLGVTAHGLRHQFAHEEYEKRTGQPPPVRGGTTSGAADVAARQAVAEHLGHGRKQITGAYLGGVRRANPPRA